MQPLPVLSLDKKCRRVYVNQKQEKAMYTADSRDKGLAIFRAHRAAKKEIAILAKEVAVSNPDKTPEECKTLAKEILAARKREAQRKNDKGKKGKGKGKGKRRHNNRSHNAPTSSQRKAVVTKVEGIKK